VLVEVSGLRPNTVDSYAATVTTTAGTAHATAPARFITDPDPPTVGRIRFSNVRRTKLALSFTVNERGARTQYSFDYGRDERLNLSSSTGVLRGVDTGTWVTRCPVSSLRPHTRYYFQPVASNAGGSILGPMRSIKTKR